MGSIKLPLGFGMALAQNEAAMQKFEALSQAEKEALVQKTHYVNSKQEMRSLVSSLVNAAGGDTL